MGEDGGGDRVRGNWEGGGRVEEGHERLGKGKGGEGAELGRRTGRIRHNLIYYCTGQLEL